MKAITLAIDSDDRKRCAARPTSCEEKPSRWISGDSPVSCSAGEQGRTRWRDNSLRR
jgi:hypothetical protein